MAYQQDYILRMIEMLGEFARALKAHADDAQARRALKDAYTRLCGLDRTCAEEMDVETLAQLLPPDRLLALSELTALRAERFAFAPEDHACLCLRALQLLVRVEDIDVAVSQRDRVLSLLEAAGDGVDAADCASVVHFLFLSGSYAKAEDFLFESLSRFARPQDAITLRTAGNAFYDDLSCLADSALSAGGMTRAEISEGRADLQNHFARG